MRLPVAAPWAAALLALVVRPLLGEEATLRLCSSRVDEIVGKAIRPNGPGAAILVARDGKVLHKRGYGLACLEHDVRNTTKTVFDIGSVSKQFTAAAVLLLVERGLLGLDDDVRKLLPELAEHSKERPIRVRDLLCHTSGLRDYLDPEFFAAHVKGDPAQLRTGDVLELLAEQKLDFPTGTRHHYSNSNYALLALMVERLTKKSLGDFLQAEVFTPLGMTSTLVRDDRGRVIRRRANGYVRNGWFGEFRDARNDMVIVGDGGVWSTVEDLHRWDCAIHEGKVLKPQTWQQAFTPGKRDSGKGHGYGFGWVIYQVRGRKLVWHNGQWAGFRSYLGRYVDDGLTIIVLSNNQSLGVEAIADRIAGVYLPVHP
jgi:CubicO group peptidase (beta-lactamase class C family)